MAKINMTLLIKLKEITLSTSAPTFPGGKPLNKGKRTRKLAKKRKILKSIGV